MKIRCINGFYKFYPENALDLTRFKVLTGYTLVEYLDGYTFQELADFANYTIEGDYEKTICFNAPEVFRQNKLCFNLTTQTIVSREKVSQNLTLYKRYKNVYQCVGLPQAYGKLGDDVLTSFSGFFDDDFKVFTIEKLYTSDITTAKQETKIIEATCTADVVKIDGQDITDVKILSAGKTASSGILIINGDDKTYIAIPIDSIKSFIDNVNNLIDKLSTGILASNSGGPITLGSFTSDLASVKSALTTLKGALQ